ncbi:MAG: T9SS type A sorting domain-containing protein [Flavobacteriales bacterium]|nr:hypothetical protein [Flavobacteriales bacterium]MCC6576620.1 T9SS type A sorting domain-containing protein [Flavobacteriales bacterium]
MDLVELASGNILTGLTKYPGISLLDPNANLIHSKCFYGDSVLVMGSIQPISLDRFYFTTIYVKDSCSSLGSTTIPFVLPAIGIMDTLGNILELHHYSLNAGCTNPPGDLVVTNDGGAITWGRQDYFFALRVDSNLDPVWAKHFNHQGGVRFFKELPGGDLLAGFDMDTAGACVARMDADGNFIWCKSYMRPSGGVHDAVVQSDSAFYITGYSGTTPSQLFLMKLDGQGSVQWCKGYEYGADGWSAYHPSRIDTLPDGSFIFLATLGVNQFPYFGNPFLMKTDFNGDTIWTRSMEAAGYNYYTRDLLLSADGGILFSGVVWGDLPGANSSMPYIFKTDSLGHFPCLERHQPISVWNLFPTDSSFTLTSVDGAIKLPAYANDTVFDPLAVYDACLVTSVAQRPTAHPGHRPRIRPNPTTGRFTVEFPDPLTVDSFWSLYDTTGRLLFQRPLKPGQQSEEIDLSRFGKGTYVVRITGPEGVCNERVVVSP